MTDQTMAFDGKCAFAVSVGGIRSAPDANPKYFVEKNGTTYGFLGAVPKTLFQIIPGSAARADAAWARAQASLA
ncbi:hypothetical protein [Nocardioides baekrokdamisoli]|nr:hypothetical protein [Nocardioides baekrokdamisoli]